MNNILLDAPDSSVDKSSESASRTSTQDLRWLEKTLSSVTDRDFKRNGLIAKIAVWIIFISILFTLWGNVPSNLPQEDLPGMDSAMYAAVSNSSAVSTVSGTTVIYKGKN